MTQRAQTLDRLARPKHSIIDKAERNYPSMQALVSGVAAYACPSPAVHLYMPHRNPHLHYVQLCAKNERKIDTYTVRVPAACLLLSPVVACHVCQFSYGRAKFTHLFGTPSVPEQDRRLNCRLTPSSRGILIEYGLCYP